MPGLLGLKLPGVGRQGEGICLTGSSSCPTGTPDTCW